MTQHTLPMALALLIFTTPALAQYSSTTIYTDRSPSIPVYAFDETATDALNRGYPLDSDSHAIVDIAPSSGSTYTRRTITRVEPHKPYYEETHTVTTTSTSGPTVIYRDGADIDPSVAIKPVTGAASSSDIPADHTNSPNTNLQK